MVRSVEVFRRRVHAVEEIGGVGLGRLLGLPERLAEQVLDLFDDRALLLVGQVRVRVKPDSAQRSNITFGT